MTWLVMNYTISDKDHFKKSDLECIALCHHCQMLEFQLSSPQLNHKSSQTCSISDFNTLVLNIFLCTSILILDFSLFHFFIVEHNYVDGTYMLQSRVLLNGTKYAIITNNAKVL